MKMSKDELISKINNLEIDDNIKIELLEDVTDSMEVDNTELEEIKSKYEELKKNYIERFLKGDETKTEEVTEDEEEEKEVIDVTEI